MSSPDQITAAFLQHYYSCADSQNWAVLSKLYTNDSMLCFEGDNMKGAQAIVTKLQGLPKTKHEVLTKDCQPCPGGGLVVFASGKVSIDGGNPLNFARVFSLFPVNGDANQLMVINDIFRLNY